MSHIGATCDFVCMTGNVWRSLRCVSVSVLATITTISGDLIDVTNSSESAITRMHCVRVCACVISVFVIVDLLV